MEARHCLSAANVIFAQTGKIPATEDSKFVCAFHSIVSHHDNLAHVGLELKILLPS